MESRGCRNAQDLVKDIRSGMTDQELMKKYNVSFEKLHQTFEKLMKRKAIAPGQLYGRQSFFPQTVAVEFDAVCKWAARDSTGAAIAGFRMTNITKESLEKLNKLIDALSFGA